jgi:hypothetical protein
MFDKVKIRADKFFLRRENSEQHVEKPRNQKEVGS